MPIALKKLTEVHSHETRLLGCSQVWYRDLKSTCWLQNLKFPADRYQLDVKALSNGDLKQWKIKRYSEKPSEKPLQPSTSWLCCHVLSFSFFHDHHHRHLPYHCISGRILCTFSITKESNAIHLSWGFFLSSFYFSLPPVPIVKWIQGVIQWNIFPLPPELSEQELFNVTTR